MNEMPAKEMPAKEMPTNKQLQFVADRIAIDDLITRYAFAIDRKQFDALDTVFTPDAHIDYTSAGGIEGSYPEVRAWLEKTLAMFPMTQHSVMRSSVEIRGDTATAVSYFYNPMALPGPDDTRTLFFCGGYYHDRMVRTAQGWRIAERVEETAWMQGLPGS